MTFRNTLLTAGLLAFVASSVSAVPTIKMSRAGAAQGAAAVIVVTGVPDGSPLTGALLNLTFDAGKVGLTTAKITAAAGWTKNDSNVVGGSAIAALTNSDGMAAEGPICTIELTNNSATGAVIKAGTNSELSDMDFMTYPIPAEVKGAVVTGKLRNMAAIDGSPAVGPGGLIAVGAGTSLYLLNPDLTDAAGWTGGKEIGGPVTGRPAFGVLNGAAVVAAGTANGNAAVFALDGTQVSNGPVAGVTGIPTAPAIDPVSNTIIWAVQASGGPALVGANQVPLGTGTVTGSPLVAAGAAVAGTSAEILYARVDATGAITPQSATAVGEEVGSPVADRAGSALAAGASGKVYKMDLVTGTLAGVIADLAAGAPLSAPFFNYAAGEALFGGTDGKVHAVKAADGAVTSTDALGAKAGMPLVANGKAIVAEANGMVGVPGGASQDLAGAIAGAIAATGPTAADSIVVATKDGSVAVLPMF